MRTKIKVTKLKLSGWLKGESVIDIWEVPSISDGLKELANNPRLQVGTIRNDILGSKIKIVSAELVIEN